MYIHICIFMYTHIQASIWLWIYLYTFKQARARVSIYILKTLVAQTFLTLSQSWKPASDFHVKGLDQNWWTRGDSNSPRHHQALGRRPNRIPLPGWRAQNPKSAVLILELGFKILDNAMFAKVFHFAWDTRPGQLGSPHVVNTYSYTVHECANGDSRADTMLGLIWVVSWCQAENKALVLRRVELGACWCLKKHHFAPLTETHGLFENQNSKLTGSEGGRTNDSRNDRVLDLYVRISVHLISFHLFLKVAQN